MSSVNARSTTTKSSDRAQNTPELEAHRIENGGSTPSEAIDNHIGGNPIGDTEAQGAAAADATTVKGNDSLEENPEKSPNGSTDDRDIDDLNHEEAHSYFATRFTLLHEVVFVITAMFAQLMTQVGVGQGIVLMNIYAKTFKTTDPSQQSWYQAGYSLTVGTFILVAGRIGDIYGHRKIFIGAWALYAIFALITGLSSLTTNGIFFCAARGLLGIGPSFLLPSAIALLGRAYPPGNRKNLVFSLLGACAPSGFLLGAVFSAIFGQLASSWGWTYYMAAIMGVFLSVTSYFIIPKEADHHNVDHEVPSFDYLGAITGVTGLILFNVAWNQAPSTGWARPYVYVLLILGILFMTAFFLIENRTTHPLVPIGSLNKEVGMILFIIYLGWSTFGIYIFYLFQLQLNLRHLTPLEATSNMVPITPGGLMASFLTAFMLKKHLPVSAVMLCAMSAFTIAPALLATVPVHQTYWGQIFVASLVACFGMDMSFPAATILMSNRVSRQHQGMAASLATTVINYSISIGLGMAGTVERYIEPNPVTDAQKLHGYRSAFYLGIGFSGLGMLVTLVSLYDELKERRRASPDLMDQAENEAEG